MDWLQQSAAELGRAIGAGRIDPRELTQAFLEAIERHPARDAIYARTTPERAVAEAEAASERARAGMRAGPLDGVPISWKDLYDTAGVATEGGSRLLAGRVPQADALVLRRATAAGTICLGKTHTSELAFSGLGVNPMAGTPPNAIEPDRAPGGSSSGAAVSTKLGLAAAGIGSDTGGSVRIPSGWNDLVGLKTTPGLIPLEGVLALAPSLDTVGPLCRTVEDCALLLGILADMAAPDLSDAALGDERLHVAKTLVIDGCDEGVVPAFDAAVEHLGRAGSRISRGEVPEFDGIVRAMRDLSPVVTSEAWAEWGELIEAHPGVMYARIEERFRQGKGADPAKDDAARREFARLSDALCRRMDEHGLIVMPTTPIWPPEVRRLLDDPVYFTERNLMALRNTRLANLLGLCSLTVPTGTPMCGLMLFAPPNAEARLLRIGSAIEAALAA
jgi:aspartyl-tRNA(Asn)/glutamyl-tRNA(Gln) amidotransferase subunit A